MQGVNTRKQEILGIILRNGHHTCSSQNSCLLFQSSWVHHISCSYPFLPLAQLPITYWSCSFKLFIPPAFFFFFFFQGIPQHPERLYKLPMNSGLDILVVLYVCIRIPREIKNLCCYHLPGIPSIFVMSTCVTSYLRNFSYEQHMDFLNPVHL